MSNAPLSPNFNGSGIKKENSMRVFYCPMLNENSSEMTTDSMLFNQIFDKFERKITLQEEIAQNNFKARQERKKVNAIKDKPSR